MRPFQALAYPFVSMWDAFRRWQVRRWRYYADAILLQRNVQLEHQVEMQAKMLEIRDAEITQAKEIIARDRERVKAERAGFAREVAKA